MLGCTFLVSTPMKTFEVDTKEDVLVRRVIEPGRRIG